MKLFDPFAGIKLATGHSLFHFALFFGSFMVTYFKDPDFWYGGTIPFDQFVEESEDWQGMYTFFFTWLLGIFSYKDILTLLFYSYLVCLQMLTLGTRSSLLPFRNRMGIVDFINC